MNQEDIKLKTQLLGLLDERKNIYKSALIETALFQDGDGSWKNAVTKITLQDEKCSTYEHLDYGDTTLSKICITVEELKKIINNLVDNGKFSVKKCPDIHIEGNFRPFPMHDGYLPSNYEFGIQWPVNYFEYEVRPQTNINNKMLIGTEYPLYPDIRSAIHQYFGLDTRNRNFLGNVLFLLPDYRIRISKLIIGLKNLKFDVMLNGLSEDKIIGKFFYESDGRKVSRDIRISSENSIDLDFKPGWILLYILSKEDGHILDFRQVHTTWPRHSLRDIIFEDTPEETVELLIESGESETVEFKKELNKPHDEFVESAVSFSNSEGGVIFLGVNDNGKPTGFSREGIENTIATILRDNCEPPIEPKVKKLVIKNIPIVMVEIHEGKNKPYIFKDKGIYVRRGSTDRNISRHELDEYYREKNNPYSRPFRTL